MTITALLATYGLMKADYLRQALDSIWTNQTLRPDRIVLVVDGPIGHDQEDIISKWQDLLGSRLLVCRKEKNEGLTKALNLGLQHVDTDLVARVDSDDISLPNRFRLQHDFLEAHPEIDILGGSMQEFSEDNPSICVRTYPQSNDEVRRYILKASPVSHPSVMMRQRIFANGLRYDERYPTSQDIALWYDALLAGYKISNLPDVILKFRRSDGVIKRRARRKAKNEFLIYINGIYRMKGLFTTAYCYPVARLAIRSLPLGMISWFYDSRLRRMVLKVR